MSSMQYVEAKAHIVTDSDVAKHLATKVVENFNSASWDAEEREVSSKDGEGFSEVEVRVYGFGVDPDLAIFKEVSSIGNGSYGLVVWESDFGVEGCNCYGDVELVEIEPVDGDIVWESEDFLQLSVSMVVGDWMRLLKCDLGSFEDELESLGDDLLERILPEGFLQACEDDGDVFFQFVEAGPYRDDGDLRDSDEVTVLFELDGHELRHETFEALVEALSCNPDERPVPGERFLFNLMNAITEGDVYENRMFDVDTYSILVFKSDWGGVRDVKVLVPRPTGL
ncbi:MAG: hypothetical protein IKG21_05705 [Atopobiaceae bacterium]|nr:hypothetical protein [Atopobiaceae bacterium]